MQRQNKSVLQPGNITIVPNAQSAKKEKGRNNTVQPSLTLSTSSTSYSTLLLPTTLQEMHKECSTHPLDKFVNSALSSCTSSSSSMTAMMNKPSSSNSTLDEGNQKSTWALTHAPRVTNGIGVELPPSLTLSRERYKLQSSSPPSSALQKTTLRRKSEDKQSRGNTATVLANRSHLRVDGVDDLRNATVGLLKRHIMHVDASPLTLPVLQNTTESDQSNKAQQNEKREQQQIKNINIMSSGSQSNNNNNSNIKNVNSTNKGNNTVIANNTSQGNASTTNSTNNANDVNVDLLSSDFLNTLAAQLSNVKDNRQNKNNNKADARQASITSTSVSAPELNATEERRRDNTAKQNTSLYYKELNQREQHEQEHLEEKQNNQRKRVDNDTDEAVDDRITPETLLLLLQKGRTKAAALYPRLPASSQALCDNVPTTSSLLTSQDKQTFATTLPSSYNVTELREQSASTKRRERTSRHLRVRGQTPQQFLQKPTSMTLTRSTKTKHNLVNNNSNKIITNSSTDNNNIDDTSNDTKFINLPFRQQPSNEEKRNAKLANIRRAELKANIALHEPPSLDLLIRSKEKESEEQQLQENDVEQKNVLQQYGGKQSALDAIDTESDDRTSEEIYITSELQRSSVGLTVTKRAEDTQFVNKLVNIFNKRKNARLRQCQKKKQQEWKNCANQLLLEEEQKEQFSKTNGLTKRVMPLSDITVKSNETKEDDVSGIMMDGKPYKEILHLNVVEEAFEVNTTQVQRTRSGAMKETDKRVMKEIREPVFSVLDSVLAVSREYEQVVRNVSNNHLISNTDSDVDASMISRHRQEAIRRLTSFNSTCIPEQYWLTIHNTHLCGHDMSKASTASATALGVAPNAKHRDRSIHGNSEYETEKTMYSTNRKIENTTTAECVDNQNSYKSNEMNAASSDNDTFDNVSMDPNDGDRSSYSVQVNQINNNNYSNYRNVKHASHAHPSSSSVIFPANWPTSRSQVYLLADVVDRMLECNPEWLDTLADPHLAYCILPHEHEMKKISEKSEFITRKANVNCTVAVEEKVTDNSVIDVYDESSTTAHTMPFCETSISYNHVNLNNNSNNLTIVAAENNILLDPEVQHASQQAFEQYTSASSAVVQIINTGLVELVRQVACECLERGALLDCLRQLLVDVVESHIRVLHYAKSRAFDEAQWRLQESEEKKQMEHKMHEACERAHTLEMENASLLKAQEQLRSKASRLDDLVERVHAKREKFDIHTQDEHAALLKMLEDDLTSSAGAALSKLYDLQFDLEKENDATISSLASNTTTTTTRERKEAPSASEARKKLEEQQHAQEQLYHNSYQLLNTLTDAVDAVNAACAPLYDEVILKQVSSMANVAAAKWATIARAIGSFERERSHRQRVFQIFSEWCDRFRRHDHHHHNSLSQSVSENVNNVSSQSHSSLIASPLHPSIDNTNIVNKDENEDMSNEQMRYLTTSDLTKMHVSDVSADEVNAMFARDFDFNAYLDTEWRHSSSSSSSLLSSNFTLSTADVNCMIHDTQVILHEIVLRLNAIAHSSIVWKGSQPPLQAPSHPLDPCVLCGRCDVVLEEKQKRQSALRAIATEVQSQIEELTSKCQHAEAERQSARAQLKTLRIELEHAKSEVASLKQTLSTIQTSNGVKQINNINNNFSSSPSSTQLEMVNASNMSPQSVFTIGRKNRLTRKTNTPLSVSSVNSVKSNSQQQTSLQETQSRRRHNNNNNNYYLRQQQQQQRQRRDSNTLVSSSSTLSTSSPSPPPLPSSPSIISSTENTIEMTDTLVFGSSSNYNNNNNNDNSSTEPIGNYTHSLSDAPPSLEHTMTDVGTPHGDGDNSNKDVK